MAKIDKNSFPSGSSPNDYQCFGPAATKDGEFESAKICDMGCFDQSGSDHNKYYHAAIVKHRTSGKWYVYFEWGRTGASKPNFQFEEAAHESDAQHIFAKQLHSKNDKRGEWVTLAGIKTLQAKEGKDCYLVRPMATRSTGLPDAKTIKSNEGGKKVVTATPANGSAKKPTRRVDDHTLRLMHDLSVATVSYARGSMADASIPTQKALDEGRDILQEAQKVLIVVGDNIDDQVKNKSLVQLTNVLYSRIPKKKALHSAPQEWILSKNNIMAWMADIDAFESALYATDIDDKVEDDPFAGMPLHMEWIDPKTELGKFLYGWWPRATGNRHGGVGSMKIKNMWKVDRHGDEAKVVRAQDEVLSGKPSIRERPSYQPPERSDCQDAALTKRYHDTNTALLFHGTRSVNVTGILREALRLPKNLVGVVITGAMFGPGLYFADDWKKSAGYTSLHGSYWSSGAGGVRGRDAFMFAADVVLGVPHVAPGPRGYTAPPSGHHCVFGKAGHSQVQNNEWIVFQAHQNRLRYLVEFAA